MFLSKKSEQLSNREMQPGETLFQYLKRKKHLALKQSLQSSIEKSQSNKQQILPITSKEVKEKQSTMQPQPSAGGPSTRRKNRKSSSKKRKVDNSFDSKNSKKENNLSLLNITNDIFKDEKTTRRSFLHKQDHTLIEHKTFEEPLRSRTPPRSFISMISPLKNRQHSNGSVLSNTKPIEKTQVNQQEKKSTIIKKTEFSTKKIIKQVMTKVHKHYNKQVQFQREVKQRIREFFLKLNLFLVQVDDGQSQNEGMQKKMKELKSTMKLLNGFISVHSSDQNQNISELIDSMYTQINQILDTFEGQVQKQSRSTCQQSIEKMKQQYEVKMDELTREKTRLSREVNLMTKENGKLEREYNQLLQRFNSVKEEKYSKEKLRAVDEDEIAQSYQKQVQKLTMENQSLTQKLKLAEKQLKQSQFKHQQYLRKTNLEHEQQVNERQAYLLKQINLLKEECANDINNINKYYLVKLEQYPLKVKALEEVIEEQKLKVQVLEKNMKDIEIALKKEECKNIENKRKIDSTLVDLCRINEELFKHWLALKDVKTLLSRLGMFDKFQRIYKDIPFDDFMFLA